LKGVIHKAYPHYSNKGLGNIGGSIWQFIHNIGKGSLIIVPLAGSFKVAEAIEQAPFYDESGYDKDYAWRRKVKWLTDKPVPRSHASNTLQRKMKFQQTCIDITSSQLQDDLVAAMTRKKPISFKSELYSDTRAIVFKHLLNSVTPTQLEKLIAKIYERQGFRAIRQPNKQDEAGDVDVLVEIDAGLGAESRPFTIGIQVKQYEGITDKSAVKQIADRLEVSGSIDRGIVVTTAESFDEDAKLLAEEFDIALVSRDELANWILDNVGRLEG